MPVAHRTHRPGRERRRADHDLQAPPRLPPQVRLHRGPPHDRVRRARRQPIHIQASPHTVTAAHPLLAYLRRAVEAITRTSDLRTNLAQLGNGQRPDQIVF
jgi:hypothetical protein